MLTEYTSFPIFTINNSEKSGNEISKYLSVKCNNTYCGERFHCNMILFFCLIEIQILEKDGWYLSSVVLNIFKSLKEQCTHENMIILKCSCTVENLLLPFTNTAKGMYITYRYIKKHNIDRLLFDRIGSLKIWMFAVLVSLFVYRWKKVRRCF